MIWHLLNVIGLAMNLAGAILIASGVIVSKENVVKVSMSGFGDADPEKNIKLPVPQDRLRQSRKAVWGAVILAVGFLVQLIADEFVRGLVGLG
jgi:hypothetical protein